MGLIVLSGPPASGKTWWGNRLRSEFGIPFLSRDDFKNPVYRMAAKHGVPPDVAADAVRSAWLVALTAVLDAGLSAVADGVFNYDAHIDVFRAYVAERSTPCLELRLDGDRDVLRRRFAARALPPLTPELEPGLAHALARDYRPIVPGAPSLGIDSTDLATVDVDEILRRVRSWLERH